MPDEIGYDLATRLITKKNCKTCQLGVNVMGMIHRQAINGAPVSDIWRWLNEMEQEGLIAETPNRQNLSAHLTNHLGYKDAAIRRHIEMRAAERNRDLEQGVQNLLTDIAVAENIVQIGHGEILEGKIKLSAKDVLLANQQVHNFFKDEKGSLDSAAAYAQLGVVLQAIREIVPEAMWQLITARVQVLSSGDQQVLEEDDRMYD